MLDSRGFITLMTPTQALISIQVMTDHSHNWYVETTTKEKINDIPDNVDAIQESFKEAHPAKECSLKKEEKAAADDEWIREFIKNTELNIKARTTIGKENIKEPVPRDLSPTPFLGHLKEQIGSPYRTRETVCMIENPGEVHKLKAQENEGDMDVGWDITVEDVERLRQFLTPTIHTLPNLEPVVKLYMSLEPVHDKEKFIREEEQDYDIPLHDGVMQPLAPQTVHITPPDDDYVAPATSPTLDKQLNEFRKECSDITRVAEKVDGNPVKDIKELSDIIKTSDFKTFVRKLLHQVSQSSHEIEREMKSHQWNSSN
ncbi:hypothetical protein Tco_0672934 [Tanacetum coccineum]